MIPHGLLPDETTQAISETEHGRKRLTTGRWIGSHTFATSGGGWGNTRAAFLDVWFP
jgi:hypothetical protein